MAPYRIYFATVDAKRCNIDTGTSLTPNFNAIDEHGRGVTPIANHSNLQTRLMQLCWCHDILSGCHLMHLIASQWPIMRNAWSRPHHDSGTACATTTSNPSQIYVKWYKVIFHASKQFPFKAYSSIRKNVIIHMVSAIASFDVVCVNITTARKKLHAEGWCKINRELAERKTMPSKVKSPINRTNIHKKWR